MFLAVLAALVFAAPARAGTGLCGAGSDGTLRVLDARTACGGLGCVAICSGGGQGDALIVKV